MTISDDPANEVVIRPNEGAGWRVEFPDPSRSGGKFVTIVVHEQEALNLAAQLCPKAQIKIFHEPGKR
ncbi:hypothetical protein AWB73_06587 [Caballeronia turbans]|jgi:hypothetical protein|uniref:hypothetical protein n=1 Tax=Caballeronia sp. INSB1 TaxID=2921751 RepID=UPI00074C1F41|nr:hypothetical protein [Caballeronia sp. INSB1]SAL59350.1 hypothetical protein AWB73_06587 [Caballeronia turbans]